MNSHDDSRNDGASMDGKIHISIVATSRNDDHGGFLTRRMQHFVDGLVAQCKRHGLRAELILVDWNPPPERLPLIEELSWPADPGPCAIRIVTVPPEVHRTFEHADKIRLFQMLAKNAGIRRARGKFILATNIDILFSDGAMRYLRDHLRPGRLYLADRVDVPADVPATDDFEAVLRFCEERAFRINTGGVIVERGAGRWLLRDRLKAAAGARLGYVLDLADKFFALPASKIANPRWLFGALVGSLRQLGVPFTTACGDFTAMSREDWFRLRGYAEWHIFSWHLDSLLIYQALGCGIHARRLAPGTRVFHIDHDGGFAPQSGAALFERLKSRGIPFITDEELRRLYADISANKRSGQEVQFNKADWGLASLSLPEALPQAT
jgi:hypothetical protein